ncbi:MAG: hypothetical protein ACKVPX_17910 [Myxococcaceae bacterium]
MRYLCLMLVCCAKVSTLPDGAPGEPAVVDTGAVPTDADGWPVGWPEAGVVVCSKLDPNDTMYFPGKVDDPARAVEWTEKDVDDPKKMRIFEQADRRHLRDAEVYR